MNVLVTGVTGYIGGRLVPRLLEQGHSVRALARDPFRLQGRPWADRVDIVHADLSEPDTLAGVFDGIDAAYFLIHSMHTGPDFDRLDREAAMNFCRAASSVPHVIYLGGLLPDGEGDGEQVASKHLLSRAEIGRILADHVPVTELRAGPIIGSGSASFEMVRCITERFPLVLAPSWIDNEVPPIGVADVLSYLVLALERGPCGVVEVGTDPMSYREMMLVYAEVRGLRRRVIPVPRFFPLRLGATSIGLWTPIPASLAGPLIEGMARPLRLLHSRARQLFPEVHPIGYRAAVELALVRIEERAVETRWSPPGAGVIEFGFRDVEGLVRDTRKIRVIARPEAIFSVLSRIGGERGWPAWGWVYRLQGLVDRALGGPGLRRGRRDSEELLVGEQVDFWRVEAASAPHLLRLYGDVRFPGRSWLQWSVEAENGRTFLTQTATISLRGLPGVVYWYGLFPLHRLFFARTLRAIRREAARIERSASAESGKTLPPVPAKGIVGDIIEFFLRRPRTSTLIEFETQADREEYSLRIMQRVGIDVSSYSVLNLHRIGVEAPVQTVFEEILQWSGHSSCWPNHIARVELPEGRVERMEIRPLGLRRFPFGARTKIGWNVPPLFVLEASEIQRSPDQFGSDNARFVLFSCSGGYPIGILHIYVRSSVVGQGEPERTQVFFGVGFDFYGKERLSRFRPLTGIWETAHNRVTANVLNRFKQVCEWRFERMQKG